MSLSLYLKNLGIENSGSTNPPAVSGRFKGPPRPVQPRYRAGQREATSQAFLQGTEKQNVTQKIDRSPAFKGPAAAANLTGRRPVG
jgi:hypothetical protein